MGDADIEPNCNAAKVLQKLPRQAINNRDD